MCRQLYSSRLSTTYKFNRVVTNTIAQINVPVVIHQSDYTKIYVPYLHSVTQYNQDESTNFDVNNLIE